MKTRFSIWAGLECTVNRVGDGYYNQCEQNGHNDRLEDLQLFKNLGVERIRYPFLWEVAAASAKPNTRFDWSWADERSAELQRLGLTPIAGLIHHGSGPKDTNLLDPHFPEYFQNYARQFVERYSWIEDYTPVNEPLTTARFSGLYGTWYPHQRNDASFFKALIHQVKATVLAMKEIRKVQPKARLIQTEDLGRAQGTEPLQYQVDFENQRRWLSFDLLTGRLNSSHPFWNYFLSQGISQADLEWLVENPCPPDILGLNHYLLSNRFLDHRLEHYPEYLHGGNGRDRYADVGAVDTRAAELPRAEIVLAEAYERYKIPIAVTEVHLHGFREDQMRWLLNMYRSCQRLQDKGVPIQAVTPWSLLGSFDWNSLCTKFDQFYESGIFDVRSEKPRPTGLAHMIQAWTKGEEFHHPVLEEVGWWERKERSAFGPSLEATQKNQPASQMKPLLITGAGGTLGRAFVRICQQRNIPYRALQRSDLDITNFKQVQKVIQESQAWAVVNTAGYVRVDQAESEPERCFQENVEGPTNLAQACADRKISFLHFSSDLVFDGSRQDPYTESHLVAPLNIYGRSKVESEKQVQKAYPDSLIVRASSFFGPWDEHNFIYQVLKTVSQGKHFYAASDITVSPTYVPDLVHLCLDLLLDQEKGVFHLTNEGHISWSDLARLATDIAASQDKHVPGEVVARPSSDLNFTAARPKFSALKSERIRVLPNFEDALHRYFKDLEIPLDISTQNPSQTLNTTEAAL